MPPSLITLEQSKFDFSEALVIVISQSGKSTDLVECERKSRLMGAKTVIITNNEDSPIINEANSPAINGSNLFDIFIYIFFIIKLYTHNGL